MQETILAALAARDAQLAGTAAAVHVAAVERWPAESRADEES